MKSLTKFTNRYPNHISVPLAERQKIREMVIAGYGTIKAFCESTGVMKGSEFSNFINGQNRICPKQLARLKAVIGYA